MKLNDQAKREDHFQMWTKVKWVLVQLESDIAKIGLVKPACPYIQTKSKCTCQVC